MQTAPKLLLLVLGLALLMTLSYAVQFNATVTNDVGTRLPGTKVQILVGNTTLSEKTTALLDDKAKAVFDLTPGVYFVRLLRMDYPDHVFMLNITKDTEFAFIMNNKKSTYSLFGRIAVDTQDWVGKKINLIDDKNTVVRSSTIQAGGIFLIDSVWPDTEYHLRLDSGDSRYNTPTFSYVETGAHYMEIGTETIPIQIINNTPLLSQVGQPALYSILSVQLKAGDRPMAGQNVSVSTPRGKYGLVSDDKGMVYVQAAAGGDYVFTWETQEVKMSVPMPPTPPAPQKNETGNGENNPAPIAPAAQPPSTPSTNGAMVLTVAGVFLLGAVIVIAVVFIFFIAPKMMKAMNKGSEKKEEKMPEVSAKTPEKAADAVEKKEETSKQAEHARHHGAKHKAHKKK